LLGVLYSAGGHHGGSGLDRRHVYIVDDDKGILRSNESLFVLLGVGMSRSNILSTTSTRLLSTTSPTPYNSFPLHCLCVAWVPVPMFLYHHQQPKHVLYQHHCQHTISAINTIANTPYPSPSLLSALMKTRVLMITFDMVVCAVANDNVAPTRSCCCCC